MFNSSILDIAIGMIFLFVLVSLLCSAINEIIAQFLQMRAKNLEAGLANLLQSGDGNKLVNDLYRHPLISGLAKPGDKPSYIPSKHFTLALMDIMSGNTGKVPTDNRSLIEAIEKYSLFGQTEAGKSIILLLHEAGDNSEKSRKNLEDWYNDAMDRVGGWYKKKTQIIILCTSLFVCISLNIDAIQISKSLWTDIALRQALVQAASSADIDTLISQMTDKAPLSDIDSAAEKSIAATPPGAVAVGSPELEWQHSIQTAGALVDEIKGLHLPIGWKASENAKETWVFDNFDAMDWMIKIIGILITTFATSLGAPFWFQLLNKIVDLRSSGKQPVKSDK